jgi:hypothetical protein
MPGIHHQDCCCCLCRVSKLLAQPAGCQPGSAPTSLRLQTAGITLGTPPLCVAFGGSYIGWCELDDLITRNPTSPNGLDKCYAYSASNQAYGPGEEFLSQSVVGLAGQTCADFHCSVGLRPCFLTVLHQAGKWVASLNTGEVIYFYGEIPTTDPVDCCRKRLLFNNQLVAADLGTLKTIGGGQFMAVAYGGTLTATPCCEEDI